MVNKIKIYTDGACSGNPGPGGWAAIVIDGKDQHILKGNEKLTTNNKMELKAFIEAIKFYKENFDFLKFYLEIYSDSKYLVDGVKYWLPNWKRRKWKTANNDPVKNIEYWQEIDEIIAGLSFELYWVKGHAKNKFNELVDKIAVEQINQNP